MSDLLILKFSCAISDLGRGPLYCIIALGCLAWGLRRGELKMPESPWLLTAWRLSMFWTGGILLNTALKFYLCAPRPWWIITDYLPLHPHPSGGFGMPSGHTQSAVGLWLFLESMSAVRSSKKQVLSRGFSYLSLIGLVWVVLIAWSRVHLHEHSFAQVSAGALVGIVWAKFVCRFEHEGKKLVPLILTIVLLSSLCLERAFNPIELSSLSFQGLITPEAIQRGLSPQHSPPIPTILSAALLSVLLIFSVDAIKRRQTERGGEKDT